MDADPTTRLRRCELGCALLTLGLLAAALAVLLTTLHGVAA